MFVRWAAQNVDADDAGRLPGLGDTVIRRFDAPEALDMRFHEVRTKSALNHVPGGTRGLPFEWTINPYRGCSHACVYCLSRRHADPARRRPHAARSRTSASATRSTAPSAVASYRRYVKTQVLAHWSTVKPAYRVVLGGRDRVGRSGDHRFLSRRGWKHVTARTSGAVADAPTSRSTTR